MTAHPLNLTDRCPTWCQDHRYDDDAENVEHEAIVGIAGPIEVALQRFVLAGQTDPVTELVLYNTAASTSAQREMVIPLDSVDDLAIAMRRVVAIVDQ